MPNLPRRKRLGPRFSEAARLLWIEVEKQGESQASLARRLSLDPSVLYHLLYGDQFPKLETALTIAREIGIAAALWERSPERPFVPPGDRDGAEDTPSTRIAKAGTRRRTG